ncbi:uncharacterized protein EAE97_002526 [Botrytis byssoidea]|uniref:Carrier domain-containing protein n=1 Tax=Botrytis byssoidea TaxID=139641 RepID=A0A9P5M2I2_9HELO|nr:uncharacterized protein EAE97_002526 [Botrytis byssoidea]KAF7950974.1 hypothetical protein EAE97_002526 [Botrytis byssoidea]
MREAIPGPFLINVIIEILPSSDLGEKSKFGGFLANQKEPGKEHHNSESTRLGDYPSPCLPTATIPKYYTFLDSKPVPSSEKLDRKSLRHLPATLTSQQLGISLDEISENLPPPSTNEKVHEAFLDTSEESTVVNDNFYHRGEDSISTIKILAAAQRINLQLRVAQIFDYRYLLLTNLTLTTAIESIPEAP